MAPSPSRIRIESDYLVGLGNANSIVFVALRKKQSCLGNDSFLTWIQIWRGFCVRICSVLKFPAINLPDEMSTNSVTWLFGSPKNDKTVYGHSLTHDEFSLWPFCLSSPKRRAPNTWNNVHEPKLAKPREWWLFRKRLSQVTEAFLWLIHFWRNVYKIVFWVPLVTNLESSPGSNQLFAIKSTLKIAQMGI